MAKDRTMYKHIYIIILSCLFLSCQKEYITIEGCLCQKVNSIVNVYIEKNIGDTILYVSAKVDKGSFAFQLSREILPTRIWIKIANNLDTTFVIDGYKNTAHINYNRENQCYELQGSALEVEYRHWRMIMAILYDDKINSLYKELQTYNILTSNVDSIQMIEILNYRLKRLQNFRLDYVQRSIQRNLQHDLSLFLLHEELIVNKDSILPNIVSKNPSSNIYRNLIYNH